MSRRRHGLIALFASVCAIFAGALSGANEGLLELPLLVIAALFGGLVGWHGMAAIMGENQ